MTSFRQLHTGAMAVASDGDVGSVVALVVDPTTRTVTHLLVKNANVPASSRVVPVEYIRSTEHERVLLDLTRAEVLDEQRFIQPEWIPVEPYPKGFMSYWLQGGQSFAVSEHLPSQGDLALRKGVEVRSSDGHHLGTVDEILVDDTGSIKQFALREGHLFGHRTVIVPIDQVQAMNEHFIQLGIDRSTAEQLASENLGGPATSR